MIYKGQVTLKKNGIDANLRSYKEGDFIGWEDYGLKRVFTAFCKDKTSVFRISKRIFELNINSHLFSYFQLI